MTWRVIARRTFIVIEGVLAAIGAYSMIWTVYPGIEITPLQSIDDKKRFAMPFEAVNTGQFPVFSVEYTCWVVQAIADNAVYRHLEVPGVAPRRAVLWPATRDGVICPSPIELLERHEISGLIMSVQTSYVPLFWPTRRFTRSCFEQVPTFDGGRQWLTRANCPGMISSEHVPARARQISKAN